MRQEKTVLVNHIQSILDDSNNFFLISYMGLSVAQLEELKGELRNNDAILQVHKNTLIKKAAEGKPYSDLTNLELTGGTAVVYSAGEPADVAKTIKKFAKENEEVTFKAAFVDGEVLDAKTAVTVADMLTKDQARAQLLGLLNQVPTSLVRVLDQKAASIVYVLNAIVEKKK